MGDEQERSTTAHTLRAVLLRLRQLARRITYGLPLGRHTPPPARPSGASNQALLLAFHRYGRAYFQRWLLLGALIGVVAGLGAIVFATAISLCTQFLLGGIAGFVPPAPAGEGSTVLLPIGRRWLIPVVTTLGGLLTGLIVFTLAPEAEGHGTDAAIDAFHEKGGRIRARIPAVKLVASAITIGSGGSAGREGPTAQISAGFGSWLGDLLHLDDHDRRIAVAAGIGSGIGAIFKAPFGGALLSAEILYKRDFEADALFPSFIASVVGFAIYGAWAGWTPVFGSGGHYQFTHVSSLVGYLILGVCAGLVGLLYPKTLYGVRDLFHRIHLPNHLKPAIGGLLVGIIGLFLPQALGMGYGYVQFSINSDFVHIAGWLMAVLVFVKILTTGLTIGSGGSGGVFGPGMVIGGFLGGALWAGLHALAPGLVAGTNAGAFAVVGMGAFFGGVAKAPLAVILMVAEMTGEYALIAPAMLATMIAYLITGEVSIYESQVPTRLDSPAHKNDYALPLLQTLTVRDAMISGLTGALATATPETSVAELSRLFRERRVASLPIIDPEGCLVGMVTPTDLARIAPETVEVSRARQVMSRAVVRAFPDESLYQAWLRMSRRGLRQLAVVDRVEPTRLLGMVTADTIAQVLRPAPASAAAATPGARGREGEGIGVPPTTGAATGRATTGRADIRPRQAQDQGAAAAHGAAEQTSQGEDEDEDEGMAEDAIAIAITPPRTSHERASTGGVSPYLAGAGDANRENGRHTEAAEDRDRTSGEEASHSSHLRPASADPLLLTQVADAMLTTPRLVNEAEPLALARQLLETRGAALMVVDAGGRLVGIITRADLRGRSDREHGRALRIGDVAVRNLVTAQPDETLHVAVRRMNRLGLRQLPVVRGELPARPLGLLRRSDILAAYEGALATSPSPTVKSDHPPST